MLIGKLLIFIYSACDFELDHCLILPDFSVDCITRAQIKAMKAAMNNKDSGWRVPVGANAPAGAPDAK
jgi:hypothetical protein